ncbi:MAG: hypothetical protein VW518_04345 [Burkholderiaceae bacterium]
MTKPSISDSFKDHQGRFRTQSLVIEYKNPDFVAPYTLKDVDTDGAVSMYRLYMEIADPTEYDTAIKLLDSWEHWQLLTGDNYVRSWFKPYISKWRSELNSKLRRQHYQRMEEISVAGKTATERMAATKWLAQQTGGNYTTPTRGRPSKIELDNKLKDELQKLEELDNDAKRIGL